MIHCALQLLDPLCFFACSFPLFTGKSLWAMFIKQFLWTRASEKTVLLARYIFTTNLQPSREIALTLERPKGSIDPLQFLFFDL